MYKYLYELVSFFENRINGYTVTDYAEDNMITVLFEGKKDKFTVIIEKCADKVIVDNVEFDLENESMATKINTVYNSVIKRINKNLLK